MIYFRAPKARTREPLDFGPFIKGCQDCVRFRQLQHRYDGPSLNQLRYVLGYLTWQFSDDDRCELPYHFFPLKRRSKK